MLPLPDPPPNLPPPFRDELKRLAVRVAELRSETAELVADTEEAVRRSRELIARLTADADRPVSRPAPE